MAKPKRKPSPSAELLRRSKRRRLPGTSNLGGELQPGEAEAGEESETTEPLAAPRHRAARRGQRAKAAAQEETVAGEEPETAEPLAAPRQMHRAARRGQRNRATAQPRRRPRAGRRPRSPGRPLGRRGLGSARRPGRRTPPPPPTWTPRLH